ncbi:hypothetical protein H9P43_002813 [Blastocladiella emersonii ATCC 22665]|nr:hypothetical protein H9P43_002813 [Blastocladiella emersonii ATCC 22665]
MPAAATTATTSTAPVQATRPTVQFKLTLLSVSSLHPVFGHQADAVDVAVPEDPVFRHQADAVDVAVPKSPMFRQQADAVPEGGYHHVFLQIVPKTTAGVFGGAEAQYPESGITGAASAEDDAVAVAVAAVIAQFESRAISGLLNYDDDSEVAAVGLYFKYRLRTEGTAAGAASDAAMPVIHGFSKIEATATGMLLAHDCSRSALAQLSGMEQLQIESDKISAVFRNGSAALATAGEVYRAVAARIAKGNGPVETGMKRGKRSQSRLQTELEIIADGEELQRLTETHAVLAGLYVNIEARFAQVRKLVARATDECARGAAADL